MVGADLDTLGDDDEVIVAADIVQPGYAFCYWQDSDGNILSYDQSVKFKKSEVMDLAITAVFVPMSDSKVSLETDNT